MAIGVTTLAEDGWNLADGIQLTLMLLLVGGVLSQVRTVLRPTRVGRWLSARSCADGESARLPFSPAPHLDGVSIQELMAMGSTSSPRARRAATYRRLGRGFAGHASVIGVVALGVLAFLAMFLLTAYVAYVVGPGEPSFWLALPFTGLTGYSTYSLARSARVHAFRGRPMTLASRAFRNSVHAWGSTTALGRVFVTSAAAASVTAAALMPVVIPENTPYDVLVVDSNGEAMFRVDLAGGQSDRLAGEREQGLSKVGLGVTTGRVRLGGGRMLKKGSLVGVVQRSGEATQHVVAVRPLSDQVIVLSTIEPPLPGAFFTGGPGVLHAVMPDDSLWHVDLATGIARQVGTVTVNAGPLAYIRGSGTLVMVAGSEAVELDPASGAILSSVPLELPGDLPVCGISDALKGGLAVTLTGSADIYAYDSSSATWSVMVPEGEAAKAPCLIAVAARGSVRPADSGGLEP